MDILLKVMFPDSEIVERKIFQDENYELSAKKSRCILNQQRCFDK